LAEVARKKLADDAQAAYQDLIAQELRAPHQTQVAQKGATTRKRNRELDMATKK